MEKFRRNLQLGWPEVRDRGLAGGGSGGAPKPSSGWCDKSPLCWYSVRCRQLTGQGNQRIVRGKASRSRVQKAREMRGDLGLLGEHLKLLCHGDSNMALGAMPRVS